MISLKVKNISNEFSKFSKIKNFLFGDNSDVDLKYIKNKFISEKYPNIRFLYTTNFKNIDTDTFVIDFYTDSKISMINEEKSSRFVILIIPNEDSITLEYIDNVMKNHILI